MKKNSVMKFLLLLLLIDGYAIHASKHSFHKHKANQSSTKSQSASKKRSILHQIKMWYTRRKREAEQKKQGKQEKRNIQATRSKESFSKNPFARPQRLTSSTEQKPQKPTLREQVSQKFESAKQSASSAATTIGQKATALKEKAKAAVSSKPVIEPIKQASSQSTDADYVYDAIDKFWEIQPTFDEKTVFAWLQEKKFQNITEVRSALILANQYINRLVDAIVQYRATVSLDQPNYTIIYKNMLEEYQKAIGQMTAYFEQYIEILIELMAEEKEASTVLAKFSRFIQKCKTEGVAATCSAMNGEELTDAVLDLFNRLEQFISNFRSLLDDGQWLNRDEDYPSIQQKLKAQQERVDALALRLQRRAEEVEKKELAKMESLSQPFEMNLPIESIVEPETVQLSSMTTQKDPVDQELEKIKVLFASENPNKTYKNLINKSGITVFQLVKEEKYTEAAKLFSAESQSYEKSTLADLTKEGGNPFLIAVYELQQITPNFSTIAESFEQFRAVYEQLQQNDFIKWLVAFRDFFEALARQENVEKRDEEALLELERQKLLEKQKLKEKYLIAQPRDLNASIEILNDLIQKGKIDLINKADQSAFDLILQKDYSSAAELFKNKAIFKLKDEKIADLINAQIPPLLLNPDKVDFIAISRVFEEAFSKEQKIDWLRIFLKQAQIFFNLLAEQSRKEQKEKEEQSLLLEKEEAAKREKVERKVKAVDVLSQIDGLLSEDTQKMYQAIAGAFDAIVSKEYLVARTAFINEAVYLLELAQSEMTKESEITKERDKKASLQKLIIPLTSLVEDLKKPLPKFQSLRGTIVQIQRNESISLLAKFYLDLSAVFIYAAEIMPQNAGKPISARDATQLAMRFKQILEPKQIAISKETGSPIFEPENSYIQEKVASEYDKALFNKVAEFFENSGEKG